MLKLVTLSPGVCRILAMRQDTSTKGSLFSSTESREEEATTTTTPSTTTTTKPDRKPAKQADPR